MSTLLAVPSIARDTTRKSAVFILAVGLLLTASSGLGALWVVSGSGGGDFTTIRGAVGVAGPGDTVLIRPGTYHEFVRISPGQGGLWLIGDGGPENVIIQADTVGIGIWRANPAVHVRGLTITGGTNLGGLYAQEAKVEVIGCVFRDNPGPGGCQSVGGAVNAMYHSDLTIEDCVIEDNAGWEAPGGVIIWQSRADIRRNVFRGNQACYGGGLEMYHCETELVSYIEENVFVGNSVSERGGGLFNVDSSPIVRRNTFFANDAPGNAAIWVLGGRPTITENIIVGSDWGVFCQTDEQYPPSLPILDCNLFWHLRLGLAYDLANTGRVIEADPRFCDPASGNFALCQDSPAISDSCGCLGALGIGCGPCLTDILPTTWGAIKAMCR
ncbi:MAG: right-handed parallel beta-helix repeat-containing protein [Candidatus Eisenbacteria bacterium]